MAQLGLARMVRDHEVAGSNPAFPTKYKNTRNKYCKIIMSQKRAHIIYSGRVQGVGFRWTAERIAHSVGVSGWVKNLPDGTVELVCEGSEEEIKSFIQKVADAMKGYLQSSKIEWQNATGEFDTFEIRFF